MQLAMLKVCVDLQDKKVYTPSCEELRVQTSEHRYGRYDTNNLHRFLFAVIMDAEIDVFRPWLTWAVAQPLDLMLRLSLVVSIGGVSILAVWGLTEAIRYMVNGTTRFELDEMYGMRSVFAALAGLWTTWDIVRPIIGLDVLQKGNRGDILALSLVIALLTFVAMVRYHEYKPLIYWTSQIPAHAVGLFIGWFCCKPSVAWIMSPRIIWNLLFGLGGGWIWQTVTLDWHVLDIATPQYIPILTLWAIFGFSIFMTWDEMMEKLKPILTRTRFKSST